MEGRQFRVDYHGGNTYTIGNTHLEMGKYRLARATGFLPLTYDPCPLAHDPVVVSPVLDVMKKQLEYLQKLFYDIWNDFGSVYLIVRYSGNSVIGKRGFTDEEKKQGLVLVFNNKTSTSLNWDGEGNLSCVLAFGPRKEEVTIHHDDMLGLLSPEAGVQFIRSDIGKKGPAAAPEEHTAQGKPQVVSMRDFKKRKT